MSSDFIDFGPNQRQARLQIALVAKRADDVIRALRAQIQAGFATTSPEILHGSRAALESGFVREVQVVVDEISEPSCRLLVRASLVTDAFPPAVERAGLSRADLQRQLEADLDACISGRFEPRFSVLMYVLDAVSPAPRLRAWRYTFSSAERAKEPSVGRYWPSVAAQISSLLDPLPNARELVREALERLAAATLPSA